MDDVAQLARRVVANLFTPLPGAGAVAPKRGNRLALAFYFIIILSETLGITNFGFPQNLQDVARCTATSFFFNARAS
jgi:hypothetical protein